MQLMYNGKWVAVHNFSLNNKIEKKSVPIQFKTLRYHSRYVLQYLRSCALITLKSYHLSAIYLSFLYSQKLTIMPCTSVRKKIPVFIVMFRLYFFFSSRPCSSFYVYSYTNNVNWMATSFKKVEIYENII